LLLNNKDKARFKDCRQRDFTLVNYYLFIIEALLFYF